MGAIQEIHFALSKSFYGRLSCILNYFDRGKTVTFSGLIREKCHGAGTEYRLSGSNGSVEKSFFTVSTAQYNPYGREHFFIMSRSGYPHVGKLKD